jgi:hypothetical protein
VTAKCLFSCVSAVCLFFHCALLFILTVAFWQRSRSHSSLAISRYLKTRHLTLSQNSPSHAISKLAISLSHSLNARGLTLFAPIHVWCVCICTHGAGLIEAIEARQAASTAHRQTTPLPYHYLTVRYLPGNTYDGWPIRIEGPLEESVLLRINGGQPFPEKLGEGARHLFGNLVTGWKVRGIFLTKIFNTLARAHWELISSNGSGGGKGVF